MITVVIVPVRDQPDLTGRFLTGMLEQAAFDYLLVLDNGSGPETRGVLEHALTLDTHARMRVLDLPDFGIYVLWNVGAEAALEFGYPGEEVNLLVMNNDVELPPGAVEILADRLRLDESLWAVYPDDRAPWHAGIRAAGVRYGQGVARTGGLYGPCFMVALERLPWRPLISDTGYEWWFGDDHLARQIEETGGRHGRVVGLPVLHENEGTARHHPETLQMRNRDRKRWIDSQRRRGHTGRAAQRRMPPGTKVWLPGGQRRENE